MPLWSRPTESTTDPRAAYGLGSWMMLRGLGLVFLIAFGSIWVQIDGLIGPSGILPAADFLRAVRSAVGAERFWAFPTVFWLGAGSGALHLASGLGVAASVLLLADVAPRLVLLVAWTLYLSLSTVAQDFLSFQWDALLLEAAVVAAFSTGGWRTGRLRAPEPPRIAVLLGWWLVFRLMFESGVVKLTSGDPTWRGLTALDYHFFTQPLPTWTAWYAHRSPEWFKRFSVAATLALEIGAPLLIWFGVPGRRTAFVAIALLQASIFTTGNFAFFNVLTLAIALPLLDDAVWRRLLPARLVRRLGTEAAPAPEPRTVEKAAAWTVFGLGALTLVGTFLPPVNRIGPLAIVAPLRSVNAYGLFRVMTTSRPEIEVQGSADGKTWLPYRFKFKPGDPEERPRFVEPHQPRLDWQMWFAALSRFENEAWFQAFLAGLLRGSPAVTGLLAGNPFPDRPPRYVRALLYEYRFTTGDERIRTGAWWTRRLVGEYAPELALQR